MFNKPKIEIPDKVYVVVDRENEIVRIFQHPGELRNFLSRNKNFRYIIMDYYKTAHRLNKDGTIENEGGVIATL